MKSRRQKLPTYVRRDQERIRAEEQSEAAAEAARRATIRKQLEAAEKERWSGIDLDQRIHKIKPFGPSAHHHLTEYDIQRFLAIKLETLGYLGCVIREPDEDRIRESVGPPSYVAGIDDAVKLIAALRATYPHVPFRAEATSYLVNQAEWLRDDDVSGAG